MFWKIVAALAVAAACLAASYTALASSPAAPGPAAVFPLSAQTLGPVKVVVGKTANYAVKVTNVSDKTVPVAQVRLPMPANTQVIKATKGLVTDPSQPSGKMWTVHQLKPGYWANFSLTMIVPDPGSTPAGAPLQLCLTVVATVDDSPTGNVSQSCAAGSRK